MIRWHHCLSLLSAAFLAGALLVAVGGTAEAKATRPRLSLAASSTSIMAGDSFLLSGRVQPAPRRGSVLVQFRKDGRWTTVGRANTNSAGQFSSSRRLSNSGRYIYRVCVPFRSRRVCSTPVKLDVYSWKNLGARTPSANDGMAYVRSSSINGVDYPFSIVTTGGPEYRARDVSLGGDCLKFRATVGMDSRTEPGAQPTTIAIRTDNTVVYSGGFLPGQSEAVALDVRGVQNFRFETFTQKNSVNEYPAYGTPQALCRA